MAWLVMVLCALVGSGVGAFSVLLNWAWLSSGGVAEHCVAHDYSIIELLHVLVPSTSQRGLVRIYKQ